MGCEKRRCAWAEQPVCGEEGGGPFGGDVCVEEGEAVAECERRGSQLLGGPQQVLFFLFTWTSGLPLTHLLPGQ